jgi:hypothetical protein
MAKGFQRCKQVLIWVVLAGSGRALRIARCDRRFDCGIAISNCGDYEIGRRLGLSGRRISIRSLRPNLLHQRSHPGASRPAVADRPDVS